MSLKFNEKSHRYWIDGKPVRSVTSLIGGGLPKPALVPWAAGAVADYVVDNLDEVIRDHDASRERLRYRLKGLPNAARDEAAVRGTEIHALAEQIVHGTSVQVSDRLLPYVNGYVTWLDKHGVEPILTEQSVGSRLDSYAGRVDCIARVDGRVLGLDWKTSKGVYSSTALQVAAYVRAEFTVTDDDPDTEIPIPEVEGTAVVHITADGTDAYWLGRNALEIGEAYQDFLRVAEVARRIKRIDGTWSRDEGRAVGGYLDLDDVVA